MTDPHRNELAKQHRAEHPGEHVENIPGCKWCEIYKDMKASAAVIEARQKAQEQQGEAEKDGRT